MNNSVMSNEQDLRTENQANIIRGFVNYYSLVPKQNIDILVAKYLERKKELQEELTDAYIQGNESNLEFEQVSINELSEIEY